MHSDAHGDVQPQRFAHRLGGRFLYGSTDSRDLGNTDLSRSTFTDPHPFIAADAIPTVPPIMDQRLADEREQIVSSSPAEHLVEIPEVRDIEMQDEPAAARAARLDELDQIPTSARCIGHHHLAVIDRFYSYCATHPHSSHPICSGCCSGPTTRST